MGSFSTKSTTHWYTTQQTQLQYSLDTVYRMDIKYNPRFVGLLRSCLQVMCHEKRPTKQELAPFISSARPPDF
jgi:hypothetical protein